MGDIPLQPGVPTDFSRQNVPGVPGLGPGSTTQHSYPQAHIPQDYPSGFPPMLQQQYGAGPQNAFSSQLDMSQAQGTSRPGPYNMNALANALPQASFRHGQYDQGQQRYSGATASPTMGGQAPMPQYAAQGPMGAMGNQQFYMAQHTQMPQYYTSPVSPTQPSTNVASRGNMGYYPNMVMNPQLGPAGPYYYAQPSQYPGQAQSMPTQMMAGQYVASVPTPVDPRLSHAQTSERTGRSPFSPEHGSFSSESRQNIVRGPPRKPKQSGHAIWIGNLPPQTELMSLVHHVCKETNGLESLFLISKSNCAFANFKDEATCITAQQQLHDSKFQAVRLVSRLRKSTVEGVSGVTAPTGPAAAAPQTGAAQKTEADEETVEDDAKVEAPSPKAVSDSNVKIPGIDGQSQKDRFFILKSLTVEDLELSVRTSIWATQSHNEENLNSAFQSVDNVYLIFSANKSGEYFGYARMTSQINEDPAAAIEFAPMAQSAIDLDLPKAIPTEPTEYAPKGRIIDDSARGTIFWEAERDETVADTGAADDDARSGSGGGSVAGDTSSIKSGQEAGESCKAWGKPFRLEWLSTSRLPFYRTRGLRNPWNSNREVKIARDGTELEPSVGRRLIGLFNRVQSPAPGGMPIMPGVLRGAPMIPGYPPVPAARPPFSR